MNTPSVKRQRQRQIGYYWNYNVTRENGGEGNDYIIIHHRPALYDDAAAAATDA